MCGRYSITITKRDLLKRFPSQDRLGVVWQPRFNLAPSQPAPVVIAPSGGAAAMHYVRWGLLPPWARSARERGFINARAEDLREKPAFRPLLPRGRCLVPADGFFEWRREPGSRRAVPYRFVLRGGAPFAFAGLCSDFRDPETGDRMTTFAILTTRPNPLVAPIHDRMPVILRAGDEAAWLDSGRLFESLPPGWSDPFPEQDMEGYEVSRAVNSIATDGPQCIAPSGREQPGLFDP